MADLLWVVNSPSFVEGHDVAPHQQLDAADVDGQSLSAFLADPLPHRVGHYFESLLHFWLREVRQLEMVGAGVQVRDGKRTIGEVDFLYRDEAGSLTHCEAAVKFFLHHPRVTGSHFPGPNASDDYERKMTKLFGQQLPLSREHFPDVVQRHAFVKGMLFCHETAPAPTELPDRMPANHGSGTWLRWSELQADHDRRETAVCIVNKPYWLAPQADAVPLSWSALCGELEGHFAGRAHPVLLSVRADSSGHEVMRTFVVSDDWPNQP